MLVRFVLSLALIAALVGCKKKDAEEAVMADQEAHEDAPHDHEPIADDEGYVPSMSGTPGPALDRGETRTLGETIDTEDALSLSELLTSCVDNDTPCVVAAGVGASCTHSGCWFTLVSDENQELVLVEIQDEAFTMPKNAAASDIVARGTLTRTKFSQTQSHYFRSEAARQLKQEAPAKDEAPTEGFLFTIDGAQITKADNADAPADDDEDHDHDAHDHHDHEGHDDHGDHE